MKKDIIISALAARLLVDKTSIFLSLVLPEVLGLFVAAWVCLFILCMAIEDAVDRLQCYKARVRRIERMIQRLKGEEDGQLQ